MKKILFITTSNLPTNPRLLKELFIARESNIEFDCILFDFTKHWSYKLDLEQQKQFESCNFIKINAGRKPLFKWISYNFLFLFFKFLNYFFQKNLMLKAFASSKRTLQIILNLPDINSYDIVIAHNPGAFFAAYYFAKKHSIKLACDVEDYHPGECLIAGKDNRAIKRIEFIMQQILPQCSYVSFASPAIMQESKKLCANLVISNWVTINNSFIESEFIAPKFQNNNKLQLVWFSQNISSGRGIELLLDAIRTLKEKVHLTLIGNLDKKFAQGYLADTKEFITIKDAMSQACLHTELSKYDIGLSCEIGTDFNRTLCLTNKIFAYLQSGLYVLASDTNAQKKLLCDLKDSGECFNLYDDSFEKILEYLYENIEHIRGGSNDRYKNNAILAWDNEKIKLLNMWRDC